MDTLHDRLARLADDAPTGGGPAAELWTRGQRAHRFRAAVIAVAVLVVGAVGAGIGARLAGGDSKRFDPAPAVTVGIRLPIEYPVGKELPDLGDTPGPLVAVWVAPQVGGGPPKAVGLVAATGTFGTLPIALPFDDPEGTENLRVVLSADGRRIAYPSGNRVLAVHDLVSGEDVRPMSEFATRAGYVWTDATHLLGHVAGGTDGDGWVWEPGTAPRRVNPYLVTYGGTHLSAPYRGLGPRTCSPSPILENVETTQESGGQGRDGRFEVPVLCDVVGVVPGSEILLGHWNSDRLPGDWGDPNDGNGTVVALDTRGADAPFEDPALRQVVVTARSPERVSLASDLIGRVLDAAGGSQ